MYALAVAFAWVVQTIAVDWSRNVNNWHSDQEWTPDRILAGMMDCAGPRAIEQMDGWISPVHPEFHEDGPRLFGRWSF